MGPMIRQAFALLGCLLACGRVGAAELGFSSLPVATKVESRGSSPTWLRLRLSPYAAAAEVDAETRRAFAQEKEADAVVEYETATELSLVRPEQKEFASEAALLAWLTQAKMRKELLVVVFSKRHKFSDPHQTLEGFWQACRATGFASVVIQQGVAFGRPILHE